MTTKPSLRDRKKAQTRQRIADVAAGLFAARGYDSVSMAEVARAADVSDQTVYNYFPAKQDLVLDRADQIRGWYDDAIRTRDQQTTPVGALQTIIAADIDRYREADLDAARGEFLAQSVDSPTLRRFTLEERERQVRVIAAAMADTDRALPPIVAHGYASALVGVIQVIHDRIGTGVLHRTSQETLAAELHHAADVALTSLDRAYRHLVTTTDPQ